MNKHFIFSVDLFQEIHSEFSEASVNEKDGIVKCGESFICSYDILQKKQIKTPFVQMDFVGNGSGKIVGEGINKLYFLLHASDEKALNYESLSHFQVKETSLGGFWINQNRDNRYLKDTEVVFFMHEPTCTAYSSFNKILDESSSLEQFIQKIESLFDFHNNDQRDLKRKEFLQSLGYRNELDASLSNTNSNFPYVDIKKYYV